MAHRKKKRVPVAAIVSTLTLLLVAFLVASWVLRRRRREENPIEATHPEDEVEPQVEAPAQPEPMLTLDDGLMTIRDYDAWFAMLPRAIRKAMRRGHTDAESILVDVFASLLPDEQWPPPVGSAARWQWQELVSSTASLLQDEPDPSPSRKLRVVGPSGASA